MINTTLTSPAMMNPVVTEMMGFVLEVDMDGLRVKRKVIAGKTVGKGKAMLLVDTEVEGQEKSRQWVCAEFFKSWVEKFSRLGINHGHPKRQDVSW